MISLKYTRLLGLALLGVCCLSNWMHATSIGFVYSDYTGETAYDVGGGYAFVSNNGGVSIYDIRDPSAVSLVAAPGWVGAAVFGLALDESLLCLAAPRLGTILADVSDPADPVDLGTQRESGETYKLLIHDDVLCAARYSNGIAGFAVSASRFARPRFVFRHSGEAWDLGVSGDIVCVADLQDGVEVVDVSDPSSPVLIASDDAWSPHSLVFQDGYIHLGDQDAGYVLLKLNLDEPTGS